MLELGVKTLLAYLLGSVSGSLLVGRLRGGVDIRTLGSGNAGGTNALRTQGFGFAFWVMVIDIGKGALAAAWLPFAALPAASGDPAIHRAWLTVACATAAVIGHVYPVWHGFRGGKGAATLLGAVAGVEPAALAPVLCVWLLVVMASGYVSLGTMLAVGAFPVYVALTQDQHLAPLLMFGCAMTAFVCYTHRSNIARLRAGSENRAQRLWLLRPR